MNIKSKPNFNKITNQLTIKEYTFDKKIIHQHCEDWRKKYFGDSELILFPKTVKSLSNIVKECASQKISIVPQGGNTSLVGGSVPRKGKSEIIINLKNLNKVRYLDKFGFSIVLESGCILEDIQNIVKKENLVFPISMGSRGSCQIGGNIATNAGGLNVIKYGLLKSNIIGIEAIMSDGNIFSDLRNIKKNNTGYDLKQLLIGSEGTLGIITAANIKLFPHSKDKNVLFASCNEFKKILDLYFFVQNNFSDLLTSFEVLNNDAMELVKKYNNDINNHPEIGKYYALIEISNFLGISSFKDFIINKFSNFMIKDSSLIFSKSEKENQNLWKFRELIPPSETYEKFCIQHDISIPLDKMEDFIDKTTSEILRLINNVRFINFGHMGDNNLHFNILSREDTDLEKFKLKRDLITDTIYKNTYKYGGSFSAEHGIGQLKKKEMIKYKTKQEINLMRKIKQSFDPHNILNPGKIF